VPGAVAEERTRGLSTAVEQVVDIEGALADAMQRRPYAFDVLYTNMVAAGRPGYPDAIPAVATFIAKRAADFAGSVGDDSSDRVLSIAIIVVMIILRKVIPTFSPL
jgi:hypothetical protein